MQFPESNVAKKYLQGLKGVEIGASSHNPFNLDTINVDNERFYKNYEKEQIRFTGHPAKVDVFADACKLPFQDKEFDFVINSHVLDRIWRPDLAIKEWCRVSKQYIFLIIPNENPKTTADEILKRKHVDIYDDNKYNFWDVKLFTDFIYFLKEYVEIVEVLNSDDKVGNGFCVVLRVKNKEIGRKCDITGFWHICMVNKYYEIITEQLSLMISSGLYDKSKNIYVSCVGEEQELKKVNDLFLSYDKIKIESHHTDIKEYEFPAIENIVKKDLSDSFCFYIHTKGVSYPDSEGGKHWRDYMNYYILERWNDNIEKLEFGYDTCGVKLLGNDFPPHYSGNFWWARGAYLNTLQPITGRGKKDRFLAEMWLCSNGAKAATLCQKYVDYNTKGKFTPDSDSKNKIVVHTLSYNLASEVHDATKLLYEQNRYLNFRHVIVDLGFPITEGDKIPDNIDVAKLENSKRNIDTAIKYNSEFISIKNKGVSQNWESVRNQMDIKDEDVIICADPDERPLNNGWVRAINDVITNGNKIAWCSLMMKEHVSFMKKEDEKYIGGYRVYVMKSVFNWAQGGFSGKFLNEIGGVPVPKDAPIYGWIEHACCDKMFKLGYTWAILADYYVEHTECSTLYRKWKNHVTSNVKNGQISFDEWLKNTK